MTGQIEHQPSLDRVNALQQRVETLQRRVETLQRTEEDLRRAKELFDRAERIAGLGYCEWQVGTDQCLSCSEGLKRLLGVNHQICVKGRRFVDAVHPDDAQRYRDVTDRQHRANEPYEIEYRIARSDGTILEVREIGEPKPGPDGGSGHWLACVQDVTDQRANERKVQQSEEEFRDLIVSSIQGIGIVRDRKLLFANRALADMFGFNDPKDLLALEDNEALIAPHERPRLRRQRAARVSGQPGPTRYTAEYRRKDGSPLQLESVARVVNWDGGPATQYTFVDVTERVEAEAALQASEQRFKDFAAAGSDWFWELGPDLCFTWISHDTLEGLGPSAQAWIGKPRQVAVKSEADQRKWDAHLADLKARRPFKDFRFLVPRDDDLAFYLSISGVPGFDADGAFLGYRGTGKSVTAEVRAERAAAKAYALLVDAIESIRGGFSLFDREDRLVLCNENCRSSLPGIADIMKPGVLWEAMLRAQVDRGLLEVPAEQHEAWVLEQIDMHRGGGVRYHQAADDRWHELRDHRTRDGGWAVVRSDITDLKRAEQALTESERRFKDIAEASSDWFWEMGPDLRFSWFSHETIEEVGVSLHELIGKPRQIAAGTDAEKRCARAHRADLEARRPFRDFRHRLARSVGREFHLSVSGVPVFGADGAFLGYRGTGKNITAQILAEQRAAQAQSVLNDAIESISEGFSLYDKDDRLVLWNENFRKSFAGLSDLISSGVGWETVFRAMIDRGMVRVPVEDRETWVEEQISQHRKPGCVRFLETSEGRWIDIREYPTRDGGLVLLRADITELKQAEAAIRRTNNELEMRVEERTAELRGANRALRGEIGEHQRTEEALRDSRALLEAIIEAAAMAINVKDSKQLYVFMNGYEAGVHGVVPETAVGKSPSELVDPAYGQYDAALDRHVLETGAAIPYFEEELLDKGGVRRTWLTTKVPVKDSLNELRYVVSTSLDVTELKARERELTQARKMDAVGNLTGGIAHDFNNLLFVIRGNVSLLVDEVSDNSVARQCLEAIRDAATLGANLTRGLLAFSRQHPLAPVTVNLGEVVAHTVTALLGTFENSIEIEVSRAEPVWPVLIDRHQMENALLNLALNARDAMPASGRLRLSVENRRVTNGGAKHGYHLPRDDYVRLVVADTGVGMPPDIMEQAFEPFFTTKSVGSGTGLGLSMVYGFIKQSGGYIDIKSTVGQGTKITIHLPRANGIEGRRQPLEEDVERMVKGGTETILVTEDDAAVRWVAVRLLRKLGYQIREASNGPEALAIIDDGASIDLLFTDILLPAGLNGAQLARAAQARMPSLKLLFASGYSETAVVAEVGYADTVPLLSKPYDVEELARLVRHVLDTAQPAAASEPARLPRQGKAVPRR